MAHVLVVDDEPAIREAIAAILEADGHRITHARDGVEALEVLGRVPPDLIVLDLAMPGMDGWRFLEELHRRRLRHRTRVVIVSGAYDPSAATADERSTRVLRKPFEPEALSRLVTDALATPAEELYDRSEHTHDLVRLIERVDEVLP